MPTNIDVTFKGGLGTVIAKLFRNGQKIDEGKTDKTGTITFLIDAMKDDAISLNGISPANGTDISINVTTDPSTPVHYSAGPLIRDFDVL